MSLVHGKARWGFRLWSTRGQNCHQDTDKKSLFHGNVIFYRKDQRNLDECQFA
jgi:hypothetical protein